MSGLASALLSFWRNPLGKILAVSLALRLTGLFWGLPASDGWDDDGIAPRDFLVGVIQSYWPGHHYIYPPFHLLLLSLAEAPIWLATLLSAPSWEPDAVIRAFIAIPPMTAMAVLARLMTVAMSLGTIWIAAKIGGDLGNSQRAGWWAAAVCGVNTVFCYYSQTTNLDVPYVFWAMMSLRYLVGAMTHDDPKALRHSVIVSAFAIATKDQAYALYLIGMPAAIALWWVLDRFPRDNARAILRELALGVALGVLILLVVDGAVTNPGGFSDRIRTLLGAASQNHAYYAKTWAGRLFALRDTLSAFDRFYPWAFAPLVVLGVLRAGFEDSPAHAFPTSRRAVAFAPLVFAVSFTIAFNMAARRSEERFVLPQSMVWGIYAGVALSFLQSRLAGRLRWAFWAVVSLCFAAALYGCMAVDVAMIFDPRYDAERWMKDHVATGDHVEVYDNNVHLPRLPTNAVLRRVDVSPIAARNPLPGVAEVNDKFSNIEARQPRFIVVSEFWAFKYTADSAVLHQNGRTPTPEQQSLEGDVDSRRYFRALTGGDLRYRRVYVAAWHSWLWRRVDIHASLSREIWIFERVPAT